MRRTRLPMLLAVVAGALAGAAGVVVLRPGGPAAAPPAAGHQPSPAELALERTVPEIILDGVPLDRVLETLSERWAIPIDVDWAAVEQAGHDRRRPVTFKARNATLGEALNRVLRSEAEPAYDEDDEDDEEPEDGGAGGAGEAEPWPLAYAVGRARIVVSTADKIDARPLVRVYDIADLIAPGGPLDGLDTDDRPTFGIYGPYGPNRPRSSPAKNLVQLVTDTIDPDSWADNGGSLGTIRCVGRRLVVSQNRENHQQVRNLLSVLRDPPPPPKPPTGSGTLRLWDELAGRWASPDPAEAEADLARQVGPVRLDRVPLENAIEALAARFDAMILLDGEALTAAGVDLARPVTLRMENPALHQALRAALDDPGPAWQFELVTDSEVIIITPSTDDNRTTLTRTYDLRDWPPVAAATRPADRATAIRELIDTIQQSVDPDSWYNNGGPAGSARALGHHLIITQWPRNQDRIEQLLNALRTDPQRPRDKSATTRPAGKEPANAK